MIRLLAVAIPAVAVILGALTWWLTGRTLRPVERIRSEMAEHHGLPTSTAAFPSPARGTRSTGSPGR